MGAYFYLVPKKYWCQQVKDLIIDQTHRSVTMDDLFVVLCHEAHGKYSFNPDFLQFDLELWANMGRDTTMETVWFFLKESQNFKDEIIIVDEYLREWSVGDFCEKVGDKGCMQYV